jgi:hypothetical protein
MGSPLLPVREVWEDVTVSIIRIALWVVKTQISLFLA